MSQTDPVGRVTGWLDGFTRADVILTALPLLFVAGYALGVQLFDRHAFAVGVGAAACCAAIGDGIFWHPPTEE
jgi:hypothetical protein